MVWPSSKSSSVASSVASSSPLSLSSSLLSIVRVRRFGSQGVQTSVAVIVLVQGAVAPLLAPLASRDWCCGSMRQLMMVVAELFLLLLLLLVMVHRLTALVRPLVAFVSCPLCQWCC